MARRLQLHEKFCDILETRNVYFQPPESLKIEYPTIIYKISDRNDLKADDTLYRNYVAYEVMFISRDPDSEIPDILMKTFKYVTHISSYSKDNLHHDVFIINY